MCTGPIYDPALYLVVSLLLLLIELNVYARRLLVYWGPISDPTLPLSAIEMVLDIGPVCDPALPSSAVKMGLDMPPIHESICYPALPLSAVKMGFGYYVPLSPVYRKADLRPTQLLPLSLYSYAVFIYDWLCVRG